MQRGFFGSSWTGYAIALAAVATALAPSWLDLQESGRVISYCISAGLIIALGGAMHAARRRAESDAARADERAAALAREVADHRRTRADLEERERDLQIVTDTMTAGVARCSRDLRYLWANRLYAEWTTHGRTREEIVGRPIVEVLGTEAMERIRPHIEQVLSGRRVEYQRLARRDSGMRWINVALDPTYGADGKPDGWVSVVQDIDASKRAVESLREAREQLEAVTDNMPAGVIRVGNDLRIQWVNPVYERWHKKPARELVGRPLGEVIGEAAMREVAPSITRVLQGEQVKYERLADFPGLGRRWLSAVLAPVLDASGHPEGWVAITADVHDRKLAEQALREADRRKDDFLATLAHELRNPLAPIRNATAILGRKAPLDPEVAWSREVIARQVDQMSRLIEDLLDIERIARGKFLARKERVLLERAIDMALEMSRPYITAAGHRLSVLMPSERVYLDADPARLAQVFSNLLNNAAKFTEPRGTIALSATLEDGGVAVTVEDSGIGFAPEIALQLFKPYSQLTQERPRGGLGIGLSLVQGIVSLHGGTVQAHSAGPGKGARFTVRLPTAPGGGADEADARGEQAVSAAGGLRVLVADDNRDAADSLCRILSLYGHVVEVAYDGIAAVAAAQRFEPDVAVLDIGMPGASGYEVAKRLRSAHGARLTLIALTGWGQEHDRRRAREAGFDHHLTKPVDPGALHELVTEAAQSSERAGGAVDARGRIG